MNNYISVAEFARKIEVSKAKAYSIIEQEEYKEYIKIINGIKGVSIELVEVYLNRYIKEKRNDESIEEKKDLDNTKKTIEADIDYKYLLELQNKRIEELENQIKEKDKVILDYANKFAEMATQAQSIAVSALTTTGQAQYLQATQQTGMIVEEKELPETKTFWQRFFGK